MLIGLKIVGIWLKYNGFISENIDVYFYYATHMKSVILNDSPILSQIAWTYERFLTKISFVTVKAYFATFFVILQRHTN